MPCFCVCRHAWGCTHRNGVNGSTYMLSDHLILVHGQREVPMCMYKKTYRHIQKWRHIRMHTCVALTLSLCMLRAHRTIICPNRGRHMSEVHMQAQRAQGMHRCSCHSLSVHVQRKKYTETKIHSCTHTGSEERVTYTLHGQRKTWIGT